METMQTEISGLARKLDSLTRGLEDLTNLVTSTIVGSNFLANPEISVCIVSIYNHPHLDFELSAVISNTIDKS